jgi:hypothetical protein
MIVAKPGETFEQHRDDIVVYQLKFADWSTNLEKADDRTATIRANVQKGRDQIFAKALPYRPGSQVQEVRVSGGSKNGVYEIVRIVKSPTETRRRSFIVKVL